MRASIISVALGTLVWAIAGSRISQDFDLTPDKAHDVGWQVGACFFFLILGITAAFSQATVK